MAKVEAWLVEFDDSYPRATTLKVRVGDSVPFGLLR